uniref:Uncharacterized protein n=1 Tax=viral metagenome TaxID=1070528 RepID=A0A6H1ZNX8_9ZZZZ
MFFSKNINVLYTYSEASPLDTELKLSAGVIHQVDILFPVNANREVYVRIFQAGYQLIPTNRDDWIRANNTVISTREFYDLVPGANILTVRAYNTHASDNFLISVNIGVLPRRILQPFSFKELLAAALGMEAPAGE